MQRIKIAIQLIICVVIAFALIQLNKSFCFLSIPLQKDLQNISYNFFYSKCNYEWICFHCAWYVIFF